jgi:hypothetical protein
MKVSDKLKKERSPHVKPSSATVSKRGDGKKAMIKKEETNIPKCKNNFNQL